MAEELKNTVTKEIPPEILKDCPLPPGAYWQPETHSRWGGIRWHREGGSIVLTNNDGKGYRVTSRFNTDYLPVPPMEFEEACRYAWSYLMLGMDQEEV